MSDINNQGGNEVPENQPPAAPPPPPPAAPPAPPAGATPPPPPPTTPPAPPAPYGGTPTGFSIGNSFNWGWTKFQQNLGVIIGAVLVYLIIGAIIYGIFFFIQTAILSAGVNTTAVTYDPTTGALTSVDVGGPTIFLSMFVYAIGIIVLSIYGFIIQAGVVRGALAITRGKKLEFSDLLPTERLGTVIVAGILVSIMTGIGYLLCIIPALIVAFFSAYVVFFILDKGLGAVAAIKASWGFVNKNLGSLIGLYLASALAIFIGALLCGIGLLVALPVVLLAEAYAFRTLNNEEVAA